MTDAHDPKTREKSTRARRCEKKSWRDTTARRASVGASSVPDTVCMIGPVRGGPNPGMPVGRRAASEAGPPPRRPGGADSGKRKHGGRRGQVFCLSCSYNHPFEEKNTFGDAALWDVLPRRAAVAAAALPEHDGAPLETLSSASVELELMLNGINCGGCAKVIVLLELQSSRST